MSTTTIEPDLLRSMLAARAERLDGAAEALNPLTLEPGYRPLSSYAPPATDDDFREFSKSTGVVVPGDLAEWLRVSNGPSGFFGIGSAQSRCRVEEMWDMYPTWRQRRWFPVGRDGFGNFYVQPLGGQSPICFVDGLHTDTLAYGVASNAIRFAYFVLQEEAQMLTAPTSSRWPFDKQYVLAVDPDLESLLADVGEPWGV